MSARNRRHGHETERMVVRYLRDQGWPDACTTRQKLGHDGAAAPGDIDVWPGICVEVKSRKGSSWPSWCAQAVDEAGGRIPVVVRRTRGVPDVGRWETRVPWICWLELAEDCAMKRTVWCPRTQLDWQVTTFAELCELVREEETA